MHFDAFRCIFQKVQKFFFPRIVVGKKSKINFSSTTRAEKKNFWTFWKMHRNASKSPSHYSSQITITFFDCGFKCHSFSRPKSLFFFFGEMRKLGWTCDEDFALCLAIQIHGGDWNAIASDLEMKSSKQCRERWNNHIDPKLCVSWTDDDILTLLVHYAIVGGKWSKISTHMGFSANAVKMKYATIQRALSTDCTDPINTLLRYHYLIRWWTKIFICNGDVEGLLLRLDLSEEVLQSLNRLYLLRGKYYLISSRLCEGHRVALAVALAVASHWRCRVPSLCGLAASPY